MSHGDNATLRQRLERDDSRGEFRGDVATMSDQYLGDGCLLLSIDYRGPRDVLITRIQRYNARKRSELLLASAPGQQNQ